MTINAATVLGFFIFLLSLPLAVLAIVQVFLNIACAPSFNPLSGSDDQAGSNRLATGST